MRGKIFANLDRQQPRAALKLEQALLVARAGAFHRRAAVSREKNPAREEGSHGEEPRGPQKPAPRQGKKS